MNNPKDTGGGEPHATPCPVVGIGTSAGGVKALQSFFEALAPEARKMAYVVVVHLDPDHQSELASILAMRTSMPVIQVDRRMPLEPGRVYVITPNRRLHIADHEIDSVEFDEPRGQRAPIDHFFRSLAEQRGDGFAVILTGAGSDGAVGVKAVKEAGGLILVQDPREAEYSSMPRSAIATGVADFVLPVREIAAQLEPLLSSKEHLRVQNLAATDEDILRRLLGHVRARTGHDFSRYKRSTVLRRLARRMQVHRMERLEEYLEFFRENVEEIQALFADLLISVTTFFRDSRAFESLARQAIPALFEGKPPSDHIRVWVPGCATGEEAYSIAILLAEESARRDIRPHVQVFASDLDTGALATAREGRFPAAIEADVSEERLRRFFDREGDHYRIKREVRDIVLFATHSLLKDPPFSRLDMVSCRNLLIYLDRDLQQQTCETFAYALLPGGFLFLGNSENADNPPGLFHVVDREARIFRSSVHKGERLTLPKLMISPNILEPVGARPANRAGQYADASLHWQALEEAAPPSALVNEVYGLAHLSESAGRYLQHPRGPLTSDITELVRPELRLQLRTALHRAFEQGQSNLSLPIAVKFNGAARQVYLQVRPVRRDNAPPAALVMFIEGGELPADQDPTTSGDAGAPTGDGEALRQLYEELHATRARLKASLEEHEGASEELRAANEELQSINEEYRSTAEELETSKEELQSVNEELQTVNNELKLKLESVSRAHSDLQNLISATDVGTLFLDAALHIKRFTPRVSDLFNITASDEGRPITDFTHRLKYDRLPADARRILAELGSLEKEIESDAGQWYLMRVRPYRTVQDRIEGVVVTFVDVTARRKAEADLRESETRLQLAREAAKLGVLDYNPVRQEMWWDDRARELWGVGRDTANLDAFWKGIHPDDAGNIRDAVVGAMEPRNGGAIDCEFRVRIHALSEERWIRMHGKAFFEGNERTTKAVRLVNTVQDISNRKLWELNQKLLLGELSHRVKNILSIVQAMARQTFRGSGAPEQTLQTFEARLRSLAGAHDLLISSDWKGADLATLVDRQLDSHLGDRTKQLTVEGPSVRLSPQLAVPFAMMVHELATNALKYGSLSDAGGTVTLTWSVSERAGTELLVVRWQERGGPRVSPPPNSGFGSFLIEHGLPDAVVRRNFEPEGLVCTIETPLKGTSSGA
jgi:two-component system, chemotaxis family, CheB/CheR fusion protein